MSVQILSQIKSWGEQACMYCSTTGWAFGPVFSSETAARCFVAWCPLDPRRYTDVEMSAKYAEFLAECAALMRPEDKGDIDHMLSRLTDEETPEWARKAGVA